MRDWLGWGMLFLAAPFVAACGSDDSGGGGPGGTAAACVPAKLTLAGEVDGQPVSAEIDWTSRSWIQAGSPSTLDIGYADGQVHVEWMSVVANGDSAPATGTILMPTGTPHAGETLCGADGLVMPHGNSNYGFELSSLSLGPTCPGTSVAGYVAGCAGDKP